MFKESIACDICDAHVHVGYFKRVKINELFYYSPKRVEGVLTRCGVGEFIVSSTSAQALPKVKDLLNEAKEIRRIAGSRAHIFEWVTWHLFRHDQKLESCLDGAYDGIKLHEKEGHWIERHYGDLLKVLDFAREHQLPVQFHCGEDDCCSPRCLMKVARLYPDVRFDFAHCRPIDEMVAVIEQCDNVWTDTAYMGVEGFKLLPSFNWHHRLMFGTDLPIWQAYEDVSLTRQYRAIKYAFETTGLSKSANMAFRKFVR